MNLIDGISFKANVPLNKGEQSLVCENEIATYCINHNKYHQFHDLGSIGDHTGYFILHTNILTSCYTLVSIKSDAETIAIATVQQNMLTITY